MNPKKLTQANNSLSVDLALEPRAMKSLCTALQSGFFVRLDPGAAPSVRDLLTQTLGLDQDYVEVRIATIFLNGQPVDDIDSTPIHPGAFLSLSAAMPGMAGMLMRRGSPVAGMRALDIKGHKQSRSFGPVTIKAFNLVADEIGPQLLARGLELPPESLNRFLEEHPQPDTDPPYDGPVTVTAKPAE